MSNKDYLIRYGTLKGKKVSEAFKDGKIKELVELKEYLTESFEKNPNYAEKILTGIVAIESYLIPEYSRLMNIFLDKIGKLPKEEQIKLKKQLNGESLENNDILYIKDLVSNIKN